MSSGVHLVKSLCANIARSCRQLMMHRGILCGGTDVFGQDLNMTVTAESAKPMEALRYAQIGTASRWKLQTLWLGWQTLLASTIGMMSSAMPNFLRPCASVCLFLLGLGFGRPICL